MLPEGPLRWLVLADLLFVLGGIVAYVSPVSLALVTVFALVTALPGLRQAQQQATEAQAVWFDRAMSYLAGTGMVLAVLILLPYVTLEEGGSLWSSRWYAVLMLCIASGGVLLWNAMALRAYVDGRALLRFGLFHLGVLAVAAGLAVAGDGSHVQYLVRGIETTGFDLQVAPALAAVPGLSWALALNR